MIINKGKKMYNSNLKTLLKETKRKKSYKKKKINKRFNLLQNTNKALDNGLILKQNILIIMILLMKFKFEHFVWCE